MSDLKNILGFKIENSSTFTIGNTLDEILNALKPTRFNFVKLEQTEYESKKDIVKYRDLNNKIDITLMFRWGKFYGFTCKEECTVNTTNSRAIQLVFIADNKKEVYVEYSKLKELLDKLLYTEDIVNIKLSEIPDAIGIKEVHLVDWWRDTSCYIVYSHKFENNIIKYSCNLYTRGLLEAGIIEVDFNSDSSINKALLQELISMEE